jgi:hypothetical protein
MLHKLDLSAEDIAQRIQRLQRLHRLSGLTKKEFTQLLGRSERIYYYWESGKTAILERSASSIICSLKKIGIIASKEWLLFGEGSDPILGNDKLLGLPDQKDDIFEQFNLDFSLSSILAFYRKIYPDYISCLIDDYRYAPRIAPTTLLVAVGVPQEKFKEDWAHGYLYHLNDRQIIPIDIKKQRDQLCGIPFAQAPYTAEPFLINADQKLYPVINIRPVY